MELNLALEVLIFYNLNKIILDYGYFEYLNKRIFINNHEVQLYENLSDFNDLCIKTNVSIYFIELLKEELQDFFRNFENLLVHRIVYKNIRNLYFHCFGTKSNIVISFEGL